MSVVNSAKKRFGLCVFTNFYCHFSAAFHNHAGLDHQAGSRVWLHCMRASPVHHHSLGDPHFMLPELEGWKVQIPHGILLHSHASRDGSVHDRVVHVQDVYWACLV